MLPGTVEKVLPFGAFVTVGDGVVGLVPFREFNGRPAAGTAEAFRAGEEVSVVVTEVDRSRRRVLLASPEPLGT
ncbi:S1 RNA-binding domain-containing protein [Streptomyces sp. NPDC056683]|uniref:S1 RNA-binding domain-containing protein n=1 Tax=Streptomyces sp. NPDC056683 TaxID=3345910 RepID=UPI0036B1606A